MSFGRVLKELRKEANMTQEQLAKKLRISPQAVSRWETDFAMPDISLIVPIAEIFEVSTDVLLCHNDDFDLKESQRFDAKRCFKEGLRALLLVDTVYACELVEKMLVLSFEDENYLDFHEIWIHALTTKARLLDEDGRHKESADALRKAQFHAKELDKISPNQRHTSKIFKDGFCDLSPEFQLRINLYRLNTVIVRNRRYSGSEYHQRLIEEIKTEGTYCKE